MSYQVELKDQPAQSVLSVRTRSSVDQLPKVFGKVYGEIMQYLGAMGEQPAGPPFAAYHNMDMQNLDIEVGFPVAKRLADKGEIQAGEIPGGKFASCLYVGPYADCGAAYEAVNKFIVEKGYAPTGVSYEYFLNDPNATPHEEPQTLIVFPLKAK